MASQEPSFLKRILEEKGQNKSYFFMIASCFFWVSGYIFPNQHGFTPIETNLIRSIVLVLFSFLICRGMGLNIQYKDPKSWRVLIKRHLAITFQGFVLAWAQFVLPLGVVHTIASSGPIFTLAMQVLIFKSGSVTRQKLFGCLVAVLGIVLTSNGKELYSKMNPEFEFKSSFDNYVSDSYWVVLSTTFLLILSMCIWAYGVLITQDASCHVFEIIFHFGVTNILISAVGYTLLPEKNPPNQMYEALIWTGMLLFGAQICFTLSLNLAENIGLTNISSFMVVAVGYGFSILKYNQPVQIFSIVGTILVIVGVTIVILKKESTQKTFLSTEQEKIQNQKIPGIN